MITIIADENISYAEEAFSSFGNLKLLPGREIKRNNLLDADALIVRSITKVNKDLLEGTRVKFVGTATIGTDHIDLDYLQKNNIYFADAKGCNADAVAEYVFTALSEILISGKNSFDELTIGIIGVGNIGSRIVKLSKSLGMNVLQNDPPLKRKTGSSDFVDLNKLYDADIITLHVPLNLEGEDKTYHLFDESSLSKLKENCIIINASRGAVVDNQSLIRMTDKKNFRIVLDVWENEPLINAELLKKVFLGTPHIAGYSLEGKVNGTVMIHDALGKFLNKNSEWIPNLPAAANSTIKIEPDTDLIEELNKAFQISYDIKEDDKKVRKLIELDKGGQAKYFDSLRRNYPLRREFNNYTVVIDRNRKNLEKVFKVFRFKVELI